MRVGYNPYKDQKNGESEYIHQIVIPVYIPNHEGYFQDSLAILKLCLKSLFTTIHKKTFISIVNNGSDKIVSDYLDTLLKQNKIHELIHTENIGKLNAILKGLAGNNIELVTISDSDVMFLPNWQSETVKVFSHIPNAGVVGIVPQFKMYESYCGNVLFDNFCSRKLKFIQVKNKYDLMRFYDSIGWDRSYNQDYLEFNLGLKINSDLNVLIGSGHFVATYKRDIFEEIPSYFNYKMGGESEGYLDRIPLEKDYWRLTTEDNYAYHMGNVLEDWMFGEMNHMEIKVVGFQHDFLKKNELNKVSYFVKNRLFIKFISIKWTVKLFLKWKKIPYSMIKKY
ncbi:glycosyltransferase family 2 protein [Flavobacterium sp. LS1R49]|uniref:Glycosyltransferase family 2 protein n=1 Tax=Flavobacterium shii TaxID=2987687 RepID=A0A9X2YUQ0_9FLAO|nr:glycosyltransferase family 2 protein [Flavobacterium shii]MCV9927454.1 glycosyltransferase family 2 protein [Flavobacterium shii]